MTYILTIIFFVFGSIIGSFLNVVIYRYHTKKTLGGRSACMTCQNKLCWYELLPLVSFFALRGRCRSCQTKISRQYPLVELISGVSFAVLFLKLENIFWGDALLFSVSYFYYALMFSILLVIAVYDYKHKIIPDALVVAFSILSFVGLFFFMEQSLFLHLPSMYDLLAGVLVALPFALIWLLSRGTWMGLGDAKLAVGLGWMSGISTLVSGVVIAFWMGAIVGLGLIFFSKVFSNKYGLKSEIPFAPFLVFGVWLAFMFSINVFPMGF